MKSTLIKCLLLGSLILFGVIILMIIAGCISCACGADEKFFCGVFKYTGLTVLLISGIGFLLYIGRSMKSN